MKYLLLLLLIFACSEERSEIEERNVIIQEFQSLNEKLNSLDEVLIVAHRGNWRNAPENSMEAIKKSILSNVDMVEVDVRMTKDSVLILMHDETIDRTTNGTGLVSDLEYSYIQTLYLKNGLGRVTKFKIPTLKDVLTECKDKIYLNLDKSEKLINEIYPLLKENNTTSQVLLKGWHSPNDLDSIYGDIINEISYMPLVRISETTKFYELENYLKNFSTNAVEIIFNDDSYPAIDSLKYLNKNIWINSLWGSLCGGHDDDLAYENPDENWGLLIKIGTDIIQTDRPMRLARYLNAKKLKKKY